MPSPIIKIAIADDSVYARKGIVQLIRKFDTCDVIFEAEDGKELINTLSLLELLPDICIIETNAEILNSYSTLLFLQKLFPTVRTIALSSYDLEYTIIKMMQYGVRGYLLKKDNIDQLHSAIENVHTNGYYYSAIAPKSLFEKAKQEILPELNKEEYRLLSLTADEFNNTVLPVTMFVQENIVGDYFDQIMKKLKCNDEIDLMTYMMQFGLIPHQHFI